MDFLKSVFAGVMIAIGCGVYVSCDNKYIGALLFCVGLVTILYRGLNLYTGKVCYIPVNKPKYTLYVLMYIVGNLIGCMLVGLCIPLDVAVSMCNTKLLLSHEVVFARAILCNILIYIAVDSYKTHKKMLPTLLCIPTFILSGYEHSVADMAYFAMARIYSKEAIIFILVVIVGNAIGGMIIPACNNILTKKEKRV